MRTLLAGIVIVALCLAARAEAPLDGDIALFLPNAVWRERGENGQMVQRELLLSLQAKDGKFEEEVVGAGVAFTRSYHFAKVVSSKVEGDAISLKLDLDIRTDWRYRGGKGQVTIALKRDGQTLTGTYQGTYRGKAVSGPCTGQIPSPIAGVLPAQGGEHPRLLLREHQINALKAAAKTPQGQAIVAKLEEFLSRPAEDDPGGHAAGHAMLYCLGGQQRRAEAAKTVVKHILDHAAAEGKFQETAAHFTGVAIAYDLCFEAWDQPFRWTVARALQKTADKLLDFGERESSGYTEDPSSAWQGNVRSAAGICALSVLNDPLGPFENYGTPVLRVCQTPPSYQPGRGIIVEPVHYESIVSTHWLCAGPFPRDDDSPFNDNPSKEGHDHLASIGGRNNAAPPIEIGTQVSSRGITRTFTRLSAEALPSDNNGRVRLDFHAAIQGHDNSVWYFFTVLKNDQTRYARVWALYGYPAVWIAGQRVRDNQPVKLLPGYIPIVMEAQVGKKPGWLSTDFYFHQETERGAISYARYIEGERQKGSVTTEPGLVRTLRLAKLQVQRFLASENPDSGGISEAKLFLRACRATMGQDIAPARLANVPPREISSPMDAVTALMLLSDSK